MSSGGSEIVSGTDSGAQISGGEQDVSGTANSATIFSGSQVVEFGGTASGTTISGGTEYVSAGGTTIGFIFGGMSGTLDLAQPQGLTGTLSGWQIGDVIDFVSTSVTSAAISGATLTVTVSGGSDLHLPTRRARSEHERQYTKRWCRSAPMSLWLPNPDRQQWTDPGGIQRADQQRHRRAEWRHGRCAVWWC